MATLTIRNLDDETVRRLRERAARSGRSLEAEARLIMRRAANTDRDLFLEWVDQHKIKTAPGFDVVEEIRKARDSR